MKLFGHGTKQLYEDKCHTTAEAAEIPWHNWSNRWKWDPNNWSIFKMWLYDTPEIEFAKFNRIQDIVLDCEPSQRLCRVCFFVLIKISPHMLDNYSGYYNIQKVYSILSQLKMTLRSFVTNFMTMCCVMLLVRWSIDSNLLRKCVVLHYTSMWCAYSAWKTNPVRSIPRFLPVTILAPAEHKKNFENDEK